jgi:hypothetical protein
VPHARRVVRGLDRHPQGPPGVHSMNRRFRPKSYLTNLRIEDKISSKNFREKKNFFCRPYFTLFYFFPSIST